MSWGRLLIVVSLATTSVVAVAGREPVTAVPAQTPPDGYTNPAVAIGTSPFVLKDGAKYYQYLDGFPYGRIPIAESTDLETWTWPNAQSALIATSYAWAQPDVTKFTAPSVSYIPTNAEAQRYVLYFTGVHKGAAGHPAGQRCIGVATSRSPAGPFVEYAPAGQTPQPLVCPDNGDNTTNPVEATDPSPAPIGGALNQRLLLYQLTGPSRGIYSQRLLASGLAVDPAVPTSRIFTAPDTPPAGQNVWRDGVVERPAVAIGPDGQAWLVFSGTDPSTGRQSVGTVKCVTYGGLAPCIPYGSGLPLGVYPANGGRWFGSSDQVANPGRAQVFSDGNQSWITYQASAAGDCSGTTCVNPHTYVDKFCFAGNRPRTNAPTTGPQTRDPAAACEQDVPADWQASVGQHLQNVGAWGLLDIPSPGQTLRQIVHTTSGGSAVRVRISNRVGTEPLRIDQATVAVSAQRQSADNTVAGPIKALTFGGRPNVQVPIGSEVVSDAIRLDSPVSPGHDLAVSLFVPQHAGPADLWIVGNETSFSAPGNQVAAASLTNPTSTSGTIAVAAVDLLTSNPQGTVVVLGDSITDGFGDAPLLDTADDADPLTTANWTDVLYGRLADPSIGRARTGVVNEGLVGGTTGPASSVETGLERLDRDVLAQTGIRTVIVEFGHNDVKAGQSADQITTALQTLVQRAHFAGVRVVGMTLPPIWMPARNPATGNCEYSAPHDLAQEAVRTTVNNRIVDHTIPFDAVVRLDQVYGAKPPGDPQQVDFAMVGDDCVHPGEAGRAAIANAVDLATI